MQVATQISYPAAVELVKNGYAIGQLLTQSPGGVVSLFMDVSVQLL